MPCRPAPDEDEAGHRALPYIVAIGGMMADEIKLEVWADYT